jgi:drug/metabolite transporter (DMT)-like permease
MSVEVLEIEGAHKVEKSTCSTGGFITFTLGLISGTFSALFCKMAYQTESVGIDGQTKLFTKPIMMLLLMFAGMVPAIFFWLFQQLSIEKEKRDHVSYKTMAVLIVPCLCDLICTLLLLTAQVYITASMWQMLRGSVICITALLKRYLLNTRLRTHMWVGVGIITFAMLLVAATSMLQPPSADALSSGKDPRIGVVLVLMGCVAQGFQYVFEEKVMNVDNAPPLVVIGCEGLWGTMLTLLIIYPVAYLMPGTDNGSFENPWDSIQMAKNSKNLQIFMGGFVGLVTIYNCMAVYVTKYLSAIWHAILDNFRPITIWSFDLLIFYKLAPGSGFGEQWTQASWLQLGGLVVSSFAV